MEGSKRREKKRGGGYAQPPGGRRGRQRRSPYPQTAVKGWEARMAFNPAGAPRLQDAPSKGPKARVGDTPVHQGGVGGCNVAIPTVTCSAPLLRWVWFGGVGRVWT